MSAVVSVGDDLGRAPARIASSAMSDSGRAIADQLFAIQQRVRRSESLAGPQIETEAELLELLVRHRHATHEGEPVIPSAVHDAIALVRALPSDVPMPEVDVDPDGCVILDWTAAPRSGAGISIGRSGRLAFSWLLGSDSGNAVYGFDRSSVPEDVMKAIRRVARYGAPIRAVD